MKDMKKVKVILIVFFLGLIVSFGYYLYNNCYYRIIYLQPKNTTQCITVFNGFNRRYVAVGHHTTIPIKNYICLDISGRTNLSDALYVSWKSPDGWEMVIPNSIIKNSTLDSGRYLFATELPLVEGTNIPTAKKFNNNSSGTFDFYTQRISRNTDNLQYEYAGGKWVFP
jgi:hypothetical protein